MRAGSDAPAVPRERSPGRRALLAGALLASCAGMLAPRPGHAVQGVASTEGRFRHQSHGGFDCVECHANRRATTTANGEWCADCHHLSAGVSECVRCHEPGSIASIPFRALVEFRLSVGEPRVRSLGFDHGRHADLGCAECHSGGARFGVRRDCAACHVAHHEPERDCTACHAEPPVGAHSVEVHLDLSGCGSAGCHRVEGLDYAALRDSRDFCLACHPAQMEHEPQEPSCVGCHVFEPGGDGRGEGSR